MMAEKKKGTLSVGIRVCFILVLSLTWDRPNVAGASEQGTSSNPFQGSLPRIPEDSKLTGMAKNILDSIFKANHNSKAAEVLGRGESILSDNEELFKQKSKSKDLTNLEVRQKLVDNMLTEQVGMQTIAVGVNPKTKTVAVAGNIKQLSFTEFRSVKNRQSANVYPKVELVGFQPSDYPIIEKIVKETYPGYGIELVTPAEGALAATKGLEDLRLAENKARNNGKGKSAPDSFDYTNAQAHFFHAETQLKEHFGDIAEGTKIAASKAYCVKCRDHLPQEAKVLIEGRAFDSDQMRWAVPEAVQSTRLADPAPTSPADFDDLEKKIRRESVSSLEGAGGSCSRGGGRRRRRALCSWLKDITQVDADAFQQKLVDVPEGDRAKLLAALDQVGMDKLQGSDSARGKIKSSWKKWKSSTLKSVMGGLKRGTAIFQLQGFKSKIAISPKILAKSLDATHAKRIKSVPKDVKGLPKGGKGFGAPYKVVKAVSLGMMGKSVIGGVLNGDAESLLIMGVMIGGDKLLEKAGEAVAAKGVALAEAGRKTAGGALKIAGPIIGAATSAFSIYSLIGNLNRKDQLEEMCKKKDKLFQERFEQDCEYDMAIASANALGGIIGVVSSVVTVFQAMLKLFTVATGPIGTVFAVIDVLVSIGVQIYNAIQEVAKISSSLVGGLSTEEKFQAGLRSFFGLPKPKHLQELLDIKESYNALVTQAVGMLRSAQDYQTIVLPTNHTRNQIKVNCRDEPKESSALAAVVDAFSLLTGGAALSHLTSGSAKLPERKWERVCDTEPELEADSEADFQRRRDHRRFRVEPDTPSWGHLECKPNAEQGSQSARDPEYYGYRQDYLCHNVIAMTAPGREHLPALIDLKDGTDFVMGFPHRQHVFLVGNGRKNFTGGSADDVFILKSYPFSGTLDGAGGNNTLILNAPEARRTSIDFSTTHCPPASNCASNFKNVHHIIGRAQKPDKLVAGCSLTYVDLHGGQSATEQDEIKIPAADCNATLTLQIHPFTQLDNYHEANGEFTYQVEFGAGIQVNLEPEKNAHRFVFTNDIVYANLTYESGYLLLTNTNESKDFRCSYFKATTSQFILVTQAGLSINFDQDSDSFYGLIPPSSSSASSVQRVQHALGLVNYPNRFFISSNTSSIYYYVGGKKNDVFVLGGPAPPVGALDGRDGFDSIIIQQDYQAEATVVLDLQPEQVMNITLKSNSSTPDRLKIENIEAVIGRTMYAEVVNGSCELSYVDLAGGNENRSDIIHLSSQLSCKAAMTLMVRNFTTVENSASSGDFNYQIEILGSPAAAQTTFIQVSMEKNGRATHKYNFLMDPSSVREITFDQVSEQFEVHFQNHSWVGTIPLDRSVIYMGDQLVVQVLPEIHGIVQVQSNASAREVTGLQTYPNTFVLGMTAPDSNFTGGGKDDAYFITSEKSYGNLDGGEGANTLFLIDSLWDDRVVTVNGHNGSFGVKNGNETEEHLKFSNIQRFFAREGQADVISAGCNTELIDTKGGRKGSPVLYDLVRVPYFLDCYVSLDVAIRPNLVVMNDATDGEFKYSGDFRNGGGSTFIFLTFTPYNDHHVYLDMDSYEYSNLTLNDGRLNMTASDGSQFSVDFFIPEGEESHTQPSISFRDGLELKIFGNGLITATLFGTLRSDMLEENTEEGSELIHRYRRAAEDIEGNEVIQRYKTAARGTQTGVTMEVERDTLLCIGSGGILDILTAAPGYLNNILLHNDANETIYRVANRSSNVQIIFDLESSGPKMLDLTPVVNDDPEIFPDLTVVHETDLMLQINDVEITLKGLASPTYEYLGSWQVLLREMFLNIEEESGVYTLVAPPIVIDPKEFDSFIVDTHSLEYNMRFLTKANDSGPIKYERVKEGNNLVFTSLFQEDSLDQVASVVFYDFYNTDQSADVLYAKQVVFEVEAGVMVNVTVEAAQNIPTFEQRESEVFGRIGLLIMISLILAAGLIASIAWLLWCNKYKRGSYWITFRGSTSRKKRANDMASDGLSSVVATSDENLKAADGKLYHKKIQE